MIPAHMRSRSAFTTLLVIGVVVGIGAGFLIGGDASAVDTGFNTSVNSAFNDADLQEIASPDAVAANIIRTAIGYIGVVFLLATIFAGFLWMTAAGNEERITKAKQLLIGGVIGMAVILGAYIITEFVFTSIGFGLTAQESESAEQQADFANCADSIAEIPECGPNEVFEFSSCSCELNPFAIEEGDGLTSEEAADQLFNQ